MKSLDGGLRVAMVSEHASPLAVLGGVDAGGQNVHVAELAMAIARRGARVTVHTRRDDRALPRRVPLAPGVTVHHVDAGPPKPIPKDRLLPHMDAFAEALGRDWATSPPAVVHAHFWMSGRAALAAARPLGVPVAQTFHALGVVKRRHQGEEDTSPPARLAEEAAIARDADRIIATCSDEVFELMRLGADPRRISVVPCGVNLGRFQPDGPVAPRPRHGHRLLVVSRLVRRKGIEDAVAALTRLPATDLIVAGGPPCNQLWADPEARRLLRLAQRFGVADRVAFLGRVAQSELPALLRSADAVLCTPWYEPFGMTAVEAMACGVPVVATAVGGLVDTVVDGVTGLHVQPRRPDELAAALRALLANPGRRLALGRAGATRARHRYGWDRVGVATLDAYGRMLGAGKDVAIPAAHQGTGSRS